jgi:hypothetical protein
MAYVSVRTHPDKKYRTFSDFMQRNLYCTANQDNHMHSSNTLQFRFLNYHPTMQLH